MPHVEPLVFSQASKKSQAIWEEQERLYGQITNMKKTLAHNEEAFSSMMNWYSMKSEVATFLDDISIYLFSHAVSRESDCQICDLYFTRLLKQKNIDHQTFFLDETQKLLINYAKALVKNSKNIPSPVIKALKENFNSSQVVSLTVFGCLMFATNMFNNILQVELDDYLEPFKSN